MGRLRLYTDERGRCAMHQSGFSWLAAVSLLLWALMRRLYLVAAVSVVLGVGLSLVATWFEVGGAGQLALNVLVFAGSGALANPVHRMLLERSGWRVTAEEAAPADGGTR